MRPVSSLHRVPRSGSRAPRRARRAPWRSISAWASASSSRPRLDTIGKAFQRLLESHRDELLAESWLVSVLAAVGQDR